MKKIRLWKKLLIVSCAALLLCGGCALAEDDLWTTWTSDDTWTWDDWTTVGELGDDSVELPLLYGAAALAAGGAIVAISKRRSAR